MSIKAGFIVGVVGDLFLQFYDNSNYYKTREFSNGLGEYFYKWGTYTLHGSILSALAAGALTAGWMYVFDKLGFSNEAIPWAAVLVDDVYRVFHPYIYPSLDSYYNAYKPIETRVFNGVTALLVLACKKLIL